MVSRYVISPPDVVNDHDGYSVFVCYFDAPAIHFVLEET
jgi:hypothetical protein